MYISVPVPIPPEFMPFTITNNELIMTKKIISHRRYMFGEISKTNDPIHQLEAQFS